MLLITRSQLELMWLANFTDRLVVHLRRYFEQPCAFAGEEAVRSLIRMGAERARHYGLRLEASAQSYIDHMVMLGSRFDTDPQFPWASEILMRSEPELARMDALHARAIPFVAATAGENARNLFFAVVRARRQGLHPGLDVRPSEAVSAVHSWLGALYPERFARVRECIVPLIAGAEAVCVEVGMTQPRAIYRVLGLQFLLGHGVVDDPMVPWVRAILRDSSLSGVEREEQLWSRTEDLADRWIAVAREEGRHDDVF